MSGADEFGSCLLGVIVRVLFSFSITKVLLLIVPVEDSVDVEVDVDVVVSNDKGDAGDDEDSGNDDVVDEDDDVDDGSNGACAGDSGSEDEIGFVVDVCIVSGFTVRSE